MRARSRRCRSPASSREAKDAPEGDGWIVMVCNRLEEHRSDLLLFDALDLAKGPIATVHIPIQPALRPARQLGAGRGDRAGDGGMIEPRVEFAYEAVARLGPPVDQGAAAGRPAPPHTDTGWDVRGAAAARRYSSRRRGLAGDAKRRRAAARRDLCDADRRRRRDPGSQPRHALRPARNDGGAWRAASGSIRPRSISAPRRQFVAPAGPYDWLGKALFLCTGERWADGIRLWVWKVV